jgi:hypothetical protein
MSAPAPIRPTRLAQTFQAWRVCGPRSYVIGLYASLDEAVNSAAPECQHKDCLGILESGAGVGGESKILHLYQIKQGKPTYRYNDVRKAPERIVPLKPSLVIAMAVDAFEPTLAFDWARDRDAVGGDRSFVESRA